MILCLKYWASKQRGVGCVVFNTHLKKKNFNSKTHCTVCTVQVQWYNAVSSVHSRQSLLFHVEPWPLASVFTQSRVFAVRPQGTIFIGNGNLYLERCMKTVVDCCFITAVPVDHHLTLDWVLWCSCPGFHMLGLVMSVVYIVSPSVQSEHWVTGKRK